MRDVLGNECWGDPQEAIAQSMAECNRVSAKTGHGVGKTWIAAQLAIWFDQSRPFSKVITTAPKWEQVENLIWQEIRQTWAESRTPLIGKCLTTEINVAPNWFAAGMNTDDPIKFQGVHAVGGVFLIADEASGIMESIWQAAMGFMTQPDCKVFAIGNPNVRHGKFFRSFGDPAWRNHTVSSLQAVGKVVRGRELVTQDWIDEMRRDCGPNPERNPIYQVRVLGEFADQDESGLFPLSLLERSALSTPAPRGRHIGVDVARFGGDQSVALLLVDNRVAAVHRWQKTDLMRSASIVYRLVEKWRVEPQSGNVHVDVVGLGAGLVDRLEQLGIRVDPVDFGSRPSGGKHQRGDWQEYVGSTIKFKNLRAELYWSARRLLDEGQLVISENYRDLWTDLLGIPYGYNTAQELEIAPKEKIRAMLGRSPDDADALCVALSRKRRAQVRISVISRG